MTDKDKNVLAFTKETTFGSRPGEQGIAMRPHQLSLNISEALDITGPIVFECPECGGIVEAIGALMCEVMDGGVRYRGVPCSSCAKTFTVEAVKK